MKPIIIDGQRIKELHSKGSQYDRNSLYGTLSTGEEIRLPASTVLQMVNDYFFIIEKAKKYITLTEVVPLYTEASYDELHGYEFFSSEDKPPFDY